MPCWSAATGTRPTQGTSWMPFAVGFRSHMTLRRCSRVVAGLAAYHALCGPQLSECEPADTDQLNKHGVPNFQARVGVSSLLLHLPPRHCSAIAISPVVHSLFSSSTVCCTLLAVVSCRCSFSPHRAASAFGTPPLAYAAAFNAVASNQCGTHQPGRRE